MPGQDGTGPAGRGPRSGRGNGRCHTPNRDDRPRGVRPRPARHGRGWWEADQGRTGSDELWQLRQQVQALQDELRTLQRRETSS